MSIAVPGGRASVVSVNVGVPRSIEWRGHTVTTAIWKEPVAGRVRVDGVNLAGDDQADRRVHGGYDKAVYAYSIEDYEWWGHELGSAGPLGPATFGENLTTSGITLNDCNIGDRWHVGSVVLEVAQPRQPCFKLGIRMGNDTFPGRFEVAERPGAYLRVVAAGELQAGDEIEVVATPLPAISIGVLAGDGLPAALLQAVADDARLPEGWRRSAARALAR